MTAKPTMKRAAGGADLLASIRDVVRQSRKAVAYGRSIGLTVNAGHGLTYHNVQMIAALPGIHELNIGHAIVAQALFVGWKEAVAEMKRLMVGAAAG